MQKLKLGIGNLERRRDLRGEKEGQCDCGERERDGFEVVESRLGMAGRWVWGFASAGAE